MAAPRAPHRLAAILRALADPTRLRILALLLDGEVCVCDIHESLRVPQPRASRHLAYLRRAGLVAARKQGLWVHYRLASLPDPLLATLVASVGHCLTHLDATDQDRERLARRTGCCTRPFAPVLALPCCGGEATCPPASDSNPTRAR